MDNSISRREFIIGTATLAAVTVFNIKNAEAQTPEPTVEPMAEEDLTAVFDTMKQSNIPPLQKIGTEMEFLHTAGELPEDFPLWIAADTVPLEITTTPDSTSTANFEVNVADNQPDFIINFPGQQSAQIVLEDVTASLNLGLSQNMQENPNPLVNSLFLAKEYLGMLTNIAFAEEWQQLYNFNPKVEDSRKPLITNIEGSAITADEELSKVASTLYFITTQDKTSDAWNISDKFPVLLMAPIFIQLATTGKLNDSEGNPIIEDIGPFYIAANIVNQNPELNDLLKGYLNTWLTSGQFTLPEGTFGFAVQPKVYAAIAELTKQLEEN